MRIDFVFRNSVKLRSKSLQRSRTEFISCIYFGTKLLIEKMLFYLKVSFLKLRIYKNIVETLNIPEAVILRNTQQLRHKRQPMCDIVRLGCLAML